MQHCYIQISEWLQWRIQISGLGLESNESGKKKKKKKQKYKWSIKHYVPETFLNRGHIRRE